MLRPWLLQDRVRVTSHKSKKRHVIFFWPLGVWTDLGGQQHRSKRTHRWQSVTFIWNRRDFFFAKRLRSSAPACNKLSSHSRLVVSPGRTSQIQYCKWSVGQQLLVPSVHGSYIFYTFPFAKSWLFLIAFKNQAELRLKKKQHVDHTYIIKQLGFINRFFGSGWSRC